MQKNLSQLTKNLSIFPKNIYLGCFKNIGSGSKVRKKLILDPDPGGKKSTGSRIHNTADGTMRINQTLLPMNVCFAEVLGDLSMTLCDPFAINFLSQSAMKLVNHQVRAVRGMDDDCTRATKGYSCFSTIV
jgi:hypothetical protein